LGAIARVGSLLGEIINLEELEVEVPVQAEDIPWIDYGQPVVFTSTEIDGQWTGKIKRVGSDVDTKTQTVKVFVSIQNAHKVSLLNGVFLKVSIKGVVIDSAFSVPRKALYNDKYVYVIDDSVLVKKEVSIVRHETETVIINGGLENGDTLVVELLQGVTPGMPARPKLLTLEGEK